ncbi:hypothetical protein ACC862_38385, partial [Rhizobium ruizarguesonis]
RYTAVIENAKMEKEYYLHSSDPYVGFENGALIVWRSFSVDYESENGPKNALVIKEESEAVSIDSAEEVKVSFTDYEA